MLTAGGQVNLPWGAEKAHRGFEMGKQDLA